MKIITRYISDDGVEFASEKQCKNYIARRAIETRKLIFWDCSFNRLNPERFLDGVHYCYFPENAEEINDELSKIINDEYGLYPPNKPGYYFYGYIPFSHLKASTKWISFDEKIEELKVDVSILENEKTKAYDAVKKEERYRVLSSHPVD